MTSQESVIDTVSNSGRNLKSASSSSTAISGSRKEREAQYASLAADPKYKKYSQQVEKCLTTFENMQDWPDFSAFLKQLFKTLQAYPQFKDIPRKLIVAKRLSQCLNPALPSGVHQRALDVYAHILSVLGTDGLAKDAQLWSLGLFPFFEYASTSVKPMLLNLFESRYLPLQGNLRPVMRSFILALLPGLDEETGEYFDKVLSLLDQLSGTVSPSFFLQNIWLIMLTATVQRACAINYLLRRLPRLDTEDDINSIVGRDIGLMIRAFAAALEDDNLFVRRGGLDLLVQCLPLHGGVIKKQASNEDRVILMRAAISVVLRRDLSLNRRLYVWLLGAKEEGVSGEKQMGYLNMNGLELLRTTLRSEMYFPSSDYSNSRPFKIFISLLDKWEIGSLLTEALVYDALDSIREIALHNQNEGDDLLITAHALYEAVEPSIVWKQMFKTVRQDILNEKTNDHNEKHATDLFIFVLKTFRLQDDEVQSLHLPLIYSAIMDILRDIVHNDPSRFSDMSVRTTMTLAKELQRHISLASIINALKIDHIAEAYSFDDIACHVYGIEKETSSLIRTDVALLSTPLLGVLHNLLDITHICINSLSNCNNSGNKEVWITFIDGMQLLLDVINLLHDHNSDAIAVTWNPQEWLNHTLKAFTLPGCSFAAIDRVTMAAISLSSLDIIQPHISIDDRSIIVQLTSALLAYLSPARSAYHLRAVELIYLLEGATKHRYVESIIANSLTSSTPDTVELAYDRFGILWRLTDDQLQPGFTFKIPMLIVLESLRSNDPRIRCVGEIWMRSNLRSYTRVLDPLLYELLDPLIQRVEHTPVVKGRQLRGFVYNRHFDHNRITYLLEILVLVVQFGGQTFNRIASTTPVKQTPNASLLDRISKDQKIAIDATYMDVTMDIVFRFLQSEPELLMERGMSCMNTAIHSAIIDLLQTVVSKGELDMALVESLEATVIGKLFLMIHTSQLDLQNKLLHLLHSIISSLAASRARQSTPSNNSAFSSPDAQADGRLNQEAALVPAVNPFLIHTIIDGIVTASNRPLLQQWLDFILMSVSQFPQVMLSSLPSLATCLCRQISQALGEIDKISQFQAFSEDLISSVDDTELIMLLNALETIILLGLPTGPINNSIDYSSNEKSSAENVGLLNLVSNVFSTDTSNSANESRPSIKNHSNRSLQEAIGTLYSVWMTSTQPQDKVDPDLQMTFSFILDRTHSRCCRVFERLFRAQSLEVIEVIIDCWYKESQEVIKSEAGFQIIDFLTASAQNVVHLICESISMRISPITDRSRKVIVNPRLSDGVLFIFLEGYLERLEGPLAVQVWSRYQALAKDIVANLRDYKAQVFAVLKCLTVLVDKISQTPAMDDRRMRRDIQDLFSKLLDACVLIAGRSFDQGLWVRRNTKEAFNVNGSDSAISKVMSEVKVDEKVEIDSPQSPDVRVSPGSDLIDQINQFLATKALPNMRTYIGDNDKVATACTQITYYIINPALRAKASRPLEVEDVVLRIIEEMSHMPAAVKAWRNPVVDAFNDNKFFALPLTTGQKWMASIKALFNTDKTVFVELLGKITSTPSANIFANREYEMLMRAFNVRRMSYAILAGEKNQFLAQLPAIQEKLVDLLRNVNSPVVESEVYTCVRVLLCRLSPHNLASFWPVLLTELYRVFEQALVNPPSDASEELLSILAASKLLDLLLVLQSEEFQIHQWMFVTDTVDAIYPPDQWFPEALIDQLSEVISDLPMTKAKKNANEDVEHMSLMPLTPSVPDMRLPVGERSMRRPLLRRMKQIDSIRELVPYFSHISVMSYESVYASGGAIDWENVERSLIDDMFDGR